MEKNIGQQKKSHGHDHFPGTDSAFSSEGSQKLTRSDKQMVTTLRKGKVMQTRVNDKQADPMLIVAELKIEKMAEAIGPIPMLRNHNEVLVADEIELSVEEVEEVIAPRIGFNHNEALASNDVELEIEEMEEVIAPGIRLTNHNETLVTDVTEV